ncbi:nuclear transport factor 2 family protein [Streptomyces naphthomycinicus]|uniref:nuclear transport factor 2 family protein n=1 Tax=Streptomyces naphthomycinicus TaxID=2872625 RepID=UPI001CEC0E8D|nr:nuclear transport factor 2 family protein [Streptomyces sp. TML10]
MTDSHLASVREYYARVDAGDIPGLLALFDDRAAYARPGYPVLHGTDALSAFYRETRVIAEGTHALIDMVAAGGHVAVQGRFNGRLKDGSASEVRFADFFRFNERGLIQRRDTYFFRAAV